MRRCLVLLAAFASALPALANAATITHQKLDATTEVIEIEGDITSGDLERFRQQSLRYPKAVVILNSRGGLIYPAIEIGKIIRLMGYPTGVDDNNVCASACALIWMAGSKRLLSTSGRVGFHASYRADNGKQVESGVANALVGNYLTLLGASAKTIVFATTAPPDEILWLTVANREAAGIDFVSSPSDQQQAAASMQTPPAIQAVPLPPPVRVVLAPATPRSNQNHGFPDDFIPDGPLPRNWQWSSAPTAPWVLIAEPTDGSKLYINQKTFKPYRDSRIGWQFWLKFDRTNLPNEIYYQTLSLMIVDCYNIKSEFRQVIDYNRNGNNKSYNYNDNDLRSIAPDTVGYKIYRAVCE